MVERARAESRADYVTAAGKKIIIVHIFAKKTQTKPRREVMTADSVRFYGVAYSARRSRLDSRLPRASMGPRGHLGHQFQERGGPGESHRGPRLQAEEHGAGTSPSAERSDRT